MLQCKRVNLQLVTYCISTPRSLCFICLQIRLIMYSLQSLILWPRLSLKDVGSLHLPPYSSHYLPAVFQIKGALCARHAHFCGCAHDFQTCAPVVRTFFQSIIITAYLKDAQ